MELIVALLHNPRVLFLDEPTIGLDAVAQKQIRSFLKEVNEQKGTTIIIFRLSAKGTDGVMKHPKDFRSLIFFDKLLL